MIIRLFFPYRSGGRSTDGRDSRRGVNVSLPLTRLKGLLPTPPKRFDGGVLAFREETGMGVRAQSFIDCSSSSPPGDFRFFALPSSLPFLLEPPP